MHDHLTRDFVGYQASLPHISWPNQARLAINFVINYEEGGESNILDGDQYAENFLVDIPGMTILKNQRHLSSESMFEYGARVGIWRLLHLFEEYQLPATIFAVGLAIKKNPHLFLKLSKSTHEIAGHGYRWLNYATLSEAIEQQHIQQTLQLLQSSGKTISGWYTGRKSLATRQLIVEAGLSYDSDSYADELPFWVTVAGKPHLIIPYALDTNDCHYATAAQAWRDGNDFFNYLKNTFDCLYRESQTQAKMMTIGLHARLSGRPGRTEILRKFLDYILPHKDIWICRREEIAHHWYQFHKE